MTAKVTALASLKVEPVESVVARLEELIERAKKGEVVAVAFACVCQGGTTMEGWGCGDRQPVAPILGAIEVLKARLLDSAK